MRNNLYILSEHELRMTLSANIKKYRARRAWSQIKLAEKLNISPNFLADIGTGKSWISSLTLIKLADTLEVEVYELFKPVKKPDDPSGEELSDESKEKMIRFSKDLSIDLKQSISQALSQTVENICKQYFS